MLRRLLSPAKRPSFLVATEPAERLDMTLAGEDRPVFIRRSSTARRYTLRLKATTRQLILTMPLRTSMSAAREFLRRHEGWIAARLDRLPVQIPFQPGSVVPVRGVPHCIEHRPGARGTAWLDKDADQVPIIAVAGAMEHVPRRVRDFLTRLARADLEVAARSYAARLDVSIKRISIKDTSSRWGSCSSQGALSFSWRIVMAPPFVLDYLAAHEVAHRREMNHSSRYWRIVHECCPQTDAAESWLKAHGAGLHRYG